MSTAPAVSKRLPAVAFGAAIAVAVIAMVVAAVTGASESNLVALSYLAVPLAVFGIVGLAAGRRLNLALIYAALALVGLIAFMEVIFPML